MKGKRNRKRESGKAVLAWILAVALTVGIFPAALWAAEAEDTTGTDSVTIKVTDGFGQAVGGADVAYTYTAAPADSSGGTDMETTNGNGTTDADGKVTISGFDFTASTEKTYTLTAGTVTKDGYMAGDLMETVLRTPGQEISVSIKEIMEITVTPANVEYNGCGQNLVAAVVAKDSMGNEADILNDGSYKISYKLGEDGAYSSAMPEETTIGDYTVYVKVTKTGYADFESDAVTAKIMQKSAPISFVNSAYTDGGSTDATLTGKIPYLSGNTYDFAAKVGDATDVSVTYHVTEGSDLATISEEGILTVNYPGKITVEAEINDSNYETDSVSHTLNVKGVVSREGDYLFFVNSEGDYTLGTSDGVVSEQAVKKRDDKIDGVVTYRANLDAGALSNDGLSLDSTTGRLTVSDYGKLASAIQGMDGTRTVLSVTITATKAGSDDYGADSASYTINIKFAETPSNPYTLSGTKAAGSDWFQSNVTVTPAGGYEIAQSLSDTFGSSTILSGDGEKTDCHVYLRNRSTGAITNKIAVRENGANIKIDTAAPGKIKIYYANPIGSLTLASMTYKYYKQDVTVTFEAEDASSGIPSFEWEYHSLADAAAATGDADMYGTAIASVKTGSAGVYMATVTLPLTDARQLRGNVSVAATDNAGNRSELKEDGDTVVVGDNVAPVLSEVGVELETTKNDGTDINKEQDGVRYLSGAANVSLTITETNFDNRADVEVSVTRDGESCEMGSLSWSKAADSDSRYTTTFSLRFDGTYVVEVSYTDKSGNVMTDSGGNAGYVSGRIVVDTTAPTVQASYTEPDRMVGSTSYYNEDMTAVFHMTEANFFSGDVKVQVSKDGGAYTDAAVSWSAEGTAGVYRSTYTIFAAENHSNDGIYRFRMTYTDRSGNAMTDYAAGIFVMDTAAPVIRVSYANTEPVRILTDTENHARNYFGSAQTATVTIIEHNFCANDLEFVILAKDVNGEELGTGASVTGNALAFDEDGNLLDEAEYPYCHLEWADNGDVHTVTIFYPGDANYTFDVSYGDLATNAAADYAPDYFTVDTTPPERLSVSYGNSVLDTIWNSIAFGFYNDQMTVTITAKDHISSVYGFEYAYRSADGVSSVNTGLADQVIGEPAICYSDGRITATATFTIPQSMSGGSGQFNGTVDFTVSDRANNESAFLPDTRRIVVDNIAPTATVEYNAPENQADGISYYDEAVIGTVTITEANFYSDDVQVTATKDGSPYAVHMTWEEESTDVHVGTFRLSEDGDYVVAIDYRDKSANQMKTYTSGQMTVDTQMEAPVITINGEDGNGKAYKGEVVPAVSFSDINFESYEITLARTRYYDIGIDVSQEYLRPGIRLNEEGGSGTFDTFEKSVDTDGIYVMTVTLNDKAGHTAEAVCTFTVNRYGSVYVYGDYLADLVRDGGKYLKNVDEDLVITEYNADRLVEGSLDIDVSCSGHALDDVDYKVSPQMNTRTAVGESGWYQYEYIISKENFSAEGVYKVAVASKDATGNSPETTNYEDKNILFRVDKNAPEINSITGLEDGIINATDVDVSYSVYDSMGLASVEVYVVDADDNTDWDEVKPIQTIVEFDDLNNYEGNFRIAESTGEQEVRLLVTDLSGREMDTANTEGKDAFAPAFDFNDTVTVSTNFFVRWFANKVLFGESIATMAAGGILFLIISKRRKK